MSNDLRHTSDRNVKVLTARDVFEVKVDEEVVRAGADPHYDHQKQRDCVFALAETFASRDLRRKHHDLLFLLSQGVLLDRGRGDGAGGCTGDARLPKSLSLANLPICIDLLFAEELVKRDCLSFVDTGSIQH